MEPTTTNGEGEEASRSRSLARRRRRRPPARRRSSTVAESEAEPSSQRKRKRCRAAKEQSRKRRRAADKGREEETVARRTKKRNTGDQEEAAAAPASAASGPASSSDASSAVSSPLRWPSRPSIVIRPGVEIVEPGDSEFEATYEELESKYHEKIDRYHKLPTLDHRVPRSCLVNQNLLPVRDSATRTVRQVAKAVLGLSSYMDGKLLKRSSGFLIDWDEDNKGCTILTSALLIRSKSSLDEWLGTDEYFPDVEVRVHLLDKDETTVVARLLHYDKHFNLALFKIDVDVCAQIPCFSSELVCGQEAFVLGRDESLYLNIDHGSVQYKGPSVFEHYHYMFINCGIGQCGAGGPVINFDGQILGMATIRGMRFIPSSIILKCLHMWKKFHCIPRLHVGMKFSAIKFLDPAHAEYLSRKCNIDEGLTVTEVSGGSVAEKIGIRAGDIMECLNGECVATTVELENLLMSVSEDHLDKRSIGSSVDLPIGIFHTRKGCRRTRILRVNVSDDIEVISAGTCPVTARDSA